MTMRQSILIVILLLIPIIAIAQTAEEYLDMGITKYELKGVVNIGKAIKYYDKGEIAVLDRYEVTDASIINEAVHSDHCPVKLNFNA